MKKTWVIIIIALLGVAVIGGYAILNNIFPKADPIKFPDTESITAITLIQKDGSSVAVETADFGEILKNITNAQPTRTMSVNDYPTAKTYYTIEVDTAARQYRYFLYAENSQVYIELPYEGIYKSNQQFLDFVAEYFKD
ncbi:MAG: DUF5301 domain-containing protein [Lachnospiraceae bacterium]|nr:DUF5301 domain-containing protein [Lachnospiraceae bacterium]